MKYKLVIDDKTPIYGGKTELLFGDSESAYKRMKKEKKMLEECGITNVSAYVISI